MLKGKLCLRVPERNHSNQTIKLKFFLNKTVCYKNNVSVTVVLVMLKRMKDNAKIHYRKDLREKNKVMTTLYIFNCENCHILMNAGL